MKKVVLINFTSMYSFSVRSLAAYSKTRGIDVSLVHYEAPHDDMFGLLPEKSLELLLEKCAGSDVVGISVLSTHYLKRAVQINGYLKKKTGARIIWGGVPVICDPHFYLKYADYVCAGEGEITLMEFLTGENPSAAEGLGYKTSEGKIRVNPIPPLVDVNDLPVASLDLENTYILNSSSLLSLKEDPAPLLRLSLTKGYRLFSMRGCPYACAFCSNNRLSRAYRGKGMLLRAVQPSKIISELEKGKEIIPGLNRVLFCDDDFMARPENELDELFREYAEKIGLPVSNMQATVNSLTEKKLALLKKYGIKLESVKIGLQAANERVNKEVFRRFFDKEKYFRCLEMLASYGIPVILDIISDNPYEELSDKYESLHFYREAARKVRKASTISSPITVMDHKLMFYPGTELYDRAMNDRIIPEDYIEKVLLRRSTVRAQKGDTDDDAFLVALFSQAALKGRGILEPVFSILNIKPLFLAAYRLHFFRLGIVSAKILRDISRAVRRKIYRRSKENAVYIRTG
ncbi:MAG TPA: radical SAM protein [bacterium]|nr:radical SAM protein [bacterium]